MNFFKSKKILVTGHTGFKGSWLCWLLNRMQAEVVGYSLAPEKKKENNYILTKLNENMKSVYGDINDKNKLYSVIDDFKPTVLFHLAAQPFVKYSYDYPVETYQTNVMGTINLLDAIKEFKYIKSSVIVTTDKCYENSNAKIDYKEDDRLGGYDPYSSSKAMAELAVSAYYKSFISDLGIGLASARAGNIIGGGDFGQNRLIPDIFDAIKNNKIISIRSPNSTRPWQYILDALFGYLTLSRKLYCEPEKYSCPFNFCSSNTKNLNVKQLTDKFISLLKPIDLPQVEYYKSNFHEAKYLSLDSSKANHLLSWHSKLSIQESLEQTAWWYSSYLNGENPKELIISQIDNYINR